MSTRIYSGVVHFPFFRLSVIPSSVFCETKPICVHLRVSVVSIFLIFDFPFLFFHLSFFHPYHHQQTANYQILFLIFIFDFSSPQNLDPCPSFPLLFSPHFPKLIPCAAFYTFAFYLLPFAFQRQPTMCSSTTTSKAA
jgi:hypothetical protein